jgi:hypothetical protein
MRISVLLLLVILLGSPSFSQSKKRVLFLGNSYTERNNLPQLISNIAQSMGDTLLFDAHNPGAYTLLRHATDATSLNKLGAGHLDYVVLQEQSQRPALGDDEVSKFFRYGKILDSLAKVSNPCAETMFYMTWGRKNGDDEYCGVFPPLCTYEGMDSLLNRQYRNIADSLQAVLSPVGATWNDVRKFFPDIDLFHPDGSHPSEAGSYAAAVTFYCAIFRRNPLDIPYQFTIPSTVAQNIKMAVKKVVFDSLAKWGIGNRDPNPSFSYQVLPNNELSFKNTSTHASQYFWNFGDGNTSILENPIHKYVTNGTFTVTLNASKCNLSKSFSRTVQFQVTSINNMFQIMDKYPYPNPVIDILTIPLFKFDKVLISNILGEFFEPSFVHSSSQIEINFSNFPSGSYFLWVFRDKKSKFWKIIKY